MNTLQSVPQIFSSDRHRTLIARSCMCAAQPDAASWLGEDFAAEIRERLEFMRLKPRRVLALGLMTPDLIAELESKGAQVDVQRTPDLEAPLGTKRYDLILTGGLLEVVNDLPGALIQLRLALDEGGLLIGQMLGAGTVPALRQIMLIADGERPAARIHPQVDNRAATALLERAGFGRQVVDTRNLQVRFSSFDRLVSDLRDQALTSVLLSPAPYIGKAGLRRAHAAFADMADGEGRLAESFEILTLTGWR